MTKDPSDCLGKGFVRADFHHERHIFEDGQSLEGKVFAACARIVRHSIQIFLTGSSFDPDFGRGVRALIPQIRSAIHYPESEWLETVALARCMELIFLNLCDHKNAVLDGRFLGLALSAKVSAELYDYNLARIRLRSTGVLEV